MTQKTSIQASLLNSEFARYLRSEGLDAFERQRVRDSKYRLHAIDVLVNIEEFAIAIVADFEPKDLCSECEDLLNDRPLEWQGLPVPLIFAVSYPNEFNQVAPDEAYAELITSNNIQISLGSILIKRDEICYSGIPSVLWTPPHLNKIRNLGDLAETLHGYWVINVSGKEGKNVVDGVESN